MDVIAPEKTPIAVVGYEVAIVGFSALFAYQMSKLAIDFAKEISRSHKTKKNQHQS